MIFLWPTQVFLDFSNRWQPYLYTGHQDNVNHGRADHVSLRCLIIVSLLKNMQFMNST